VDCPLSEEGEEEAKKGGFLLRTGGYTFDKAYTSTLKRAIKTLWIALEELDLMYIPIVNKWQLNERHYGKSSGNYNFVDRGPRCRSTGMCPPTRLFLNTMIHHDYLSFTPLQVLCKVSINKKRWMLTEKNRC